MLPAISVENLSKKFQIGLRESQNRTFREAVMDSFSAPLKRFRQLSGKDHDESEFWALKDVSFEVQEGEVLGIIGRNGAGKSTLLKILSRITEPTSGRAVIRGRVASLLEVGTGFHNELSGRENVYLNGAILGMSKSEINRKFDEIVDFSGVEKFLDTPIKRYSSGMKVRLAFAVAAHLEPEILIIDEVLAVGDQEFQNKCMGKMHDVATAGRTVLFVSHNIAAVTAICSRVIHLANGAIFETATRNIQTPSDSRAETFKENWTRNTTPRKKGSRTGDKQRWRITDKANRAVETSRGKGKGEKGGGREGSLGEWRGKATSQLRAGSAFLIRVRIQSRRDQLSYLAVSVTNSEGVNVLHFTSQDFAPDHRIQLTSPECEVDLHVPSIELRSGAYFVSVWLGRSASACDHLLRSCLSFDVEPSPDHTRHCRGTVYVPVECIMKRSAQASFADVPQSPISVSIDGRC